MAIKLKSWEKEYKRANALAFIIATQLRKPENVRYYLYTHYGVSVISDMVADEWMKRMGKEREIYKNNKYFGG